MTFTGHFVAKDGSVTADTVLTIKLPLSPASSLPNENGQRLTLAEDMLPCPH